jgi:NTE family protein
MRLPFLRIFLLLNLTVAWCSGQHVGLVLSGGGARGLAHIGAIQALEENHIPIDFITGTSAGAVIGCLYALGYSPTEMDSIVRTEEFESWATGKLDADNTFYFSRPSDNASWITLRFALDTLKGTSLPTNAVSSAPYDYALMRGTSAIIARANYNFDSLFIPFRCVASDIEKKETVIFREGDLAQAVRASSAYPFYFRPVKVNGRILYDGGLYNNFPADIMQQDFKPDYIIGVNASGNDIPADETNLVSLMQAMMTTPTNFIMDDKHGILIDLNTDNIGLFDFSSAGKIVQEGYNTTMKLMDSIKTIVAPRSDSRALSVKRKSFRSDLSPIKIKNIIVDGLTGKQRSYVNNLVKADTGITSLDKLRPAYFRLISDQNVRTVDPQLIMDKTDNCFDLRLRILRERDLIAQFGGNISSRPISEAYAGVTYLLWGKRAYNFSGNFYFGKLYTSGQLRIRMETPTRTPFYLETFATLNQYDYYRSSNSLFLENKPVYIVNSDYSLGLNAGIPAGNKSVCSAGAALLRTANNYYQDKDFLPTDTADRTGLNGVTGMISFERNTLNKKQFANEGTFLSLQVRYSNVMEATKPGSTSVIRNIEVNHHDWLKGEFKYDNYFFHRRHVKLGFYCEVVASNMPLFNNYTATVVNSPAYEPILEMHTLYLPEFHAQTYAGAGSRNVISIRNNLDVRLEAYVFQPYRELLKNEFSKAYYGKPFEKRYYLASGGVVFHSPIGPLSLHINYYRERTNPVSVLFTAGFLLFNKSALD